MIITLPNENLFIELDKDGNYTLKEIKFSEKGENIGNRYEITIGYYTSLSTAVNRYIMMQLFKEDETISIKDLFKKHEDLVDQTTEYFKLRDFE